MDQFLTKELNHLLNLKNEDKFILRDKTLDLTLEIINMLFKDLNQIGLNYYITTIVGVYLPDNTYIYQQQPINQIIKLNKNDKQKKTALLLETTTNKMISFINNIKDQNNQELSPMIIDSIIENYKILFKTINQLLLEPDFIWNQSIFDEAKKRIQEEIINARFEKKGVIDLENCSRCGSKEVLFTEKQIRRADEGSTIFFQCTACSHKWRRG